MKNIWEKSLLYDILRPYLEWTTRSCYSSFEVSGFENIPDPSDASVIICSNHCNTLMDALVLSVAKRGEILFAARADVFRNRKVASLINGLKVLPIYRLRDGADFVERNEKIFSLIAESMSHSSVFGIFPEGTHRARRSLLPIKKGVFRIALRSLKEYPQRPVYIVPAGLEYYDYFNIMRPVRISFGEPMRVDNVDEMQPLQEELRRRISSLITCFPDDEDLDVRERAFYLARRPKRNILHFMAAAALLPVFLVSGVLCAPILALSAILILRLKDKAWMNTMRFASRFLLTPVLAIVAAVAGFANLHWGLALLLVIAVIYASPVFYSILSFYKSFAGR